MVSMKNAVFVAGGLVLLLLFGCTSPSSQGQPADGIGDAQISAPSGEDDAPLLLDEDVIEAPEVPEEPEPEAGQPELGEETEGLTGSKADRIDFSDLFVEDEWSDTLILEDDIVEQG